jgi:hypothetical protein
MKRAKPVKHTSQPRKERAAAKVVAAKAASKIERSKFVRITMNSDQMFDLKIDERGNVLGAWPCFGCWSEKLPVLLRRNGYIDATNFDGIAAFTYHTDLRKKKIKRDGTVFVWPRINTNQRWKYKIKKIAILGHARDSWPKDVRATIKWTRDQEADPNDLFMIDFKIDENRRVVGPWPCFGLLTEVGIEYPILLRNDGSINFCEGTYSTNLLNKEIRRGEYVSVWNGPEFQSTEYGFAITDVVILGDRELY